MVQRKPKAPVETGGETPRGRSSRKSSRGASSSSSNRLVGKRKVEVLLSVPSKDKGKRRAIFVTPPPVPESPAHIPPPSPSTIPIPEAHPGASSSSNPQIGFSGRSVPIPPAQTSTLHVRWSTAEIEDVARVDPIATAFENERLRRALRAAYFDLEQERVRNTQNAASYESEIAFLRRELQKRNRGE